MRATLSTRSVSGPVLFSGVAFVEASPYILMPVGPLRPEIRATCNRGGRTLVTVKANGRADEAQCILRSNGAYDAESREGVRPA
jgi:hypothetical protein